MKEKVHLFKQRCGTKYKLNVLCVWSTHNCKVELTNDDYWFNKHKIVSGSFTEIEMVLGIGGLNLPNLKGTA